MALLDRWRQTDPARGWAPSRGARSDATSTMTGHVFGTTLVLHPADRLAPQARSLALAVADDAKRPVVVVDMPDDSAFSLWREAADLMPRSREGVRVVVGGRSRETTALAGQWLAERLERAVLAPDGAVVPGVGGALFVSADSESDEDTGGLHGGSSGGWAKYLPGRPPSWEARRFPRPTWECTSLTHISRTAEVVAEPVLGGIWLRPANRSEPAQLIARHRAKLQREVPCQQDVFSVIVGCPGGAPVGVEQVRRFWDQLPAEIRTSGRVVLYGPTLVPGGRSEGQALAESLETAVIEYAGLPGDSRDRPAVYTVREDGERGWRSFAREILHLPPSADHPAPPPQVLSHRAPVPSAREVEPGVYWYAPDTVLEVVRAGLWVRPANDPARADDLRRMPADPERPILVFDSSTRATARRMRPVAEEVLGLLDEGVRTVCRVMSAQDALATIGTPTAPAEINTLGSADGAVVVQSSTAPAVVPESVQLRLPEPAVPEPAVPEPAVPEPAVPEPAVPEPAVPEPAVHEPVLPAPFLDRFDAPALPVPPVAVVGAPAERPRTRPSPTPQPRPSARPAQSLPERVPAPATPTPVTPVPLPAGARPHTEPAAPPPAPPPPVADGAGGRLDGAAAAVVSVQPTPGPSAVGMVPGGGLEQERNWLRSTLGESYPARSTTVARLLSQHPGLGASGAPADVLTDAVAVRLYLEPEGSGVEQGLRRGQTGPHVALARCAVSGLGRLPSHRGPVVVPVGPSPEQWDALDGRRHLTEWGFLHALTGPCGGTQTDTDVIVWAMTARRTRLLEPDSGAIEDRVLFAPGTHFKALEVVRPHGDERGRVLLRELSADEVDGQGRIEDDRKSLDAVALSALRGSIETWSSSSPPVRLSAESRPRFAHLPGLVDLPSSDQRSAA